MSRYESNKKILNILSEINDKCPDYRFWQLLYNCDVIQQDENKEIVDFHYLESDKILNNIQNSILVKEILKLKF